MLVEVSEASVFVSLFPILWVIEVGQHIFDIHFSIVVANTEVKAFNILMKIGYWGSF